ncbi:hypothetical protein GYMLUDRAFT_246432 [Collybiopsis luxurians FD-317 M1]|uniref:Uncharacterized protein n=1 Tax=Collybiopsis luxurians FD-317 M1 TaxID=944289 RepID=A0A0D0B491_9AGAR|nr:hypothetical protein GYMLUDRAFT_246432 [Collybiopsis luxurians FD-317 M1]
MHNNTWLSPPIVIESVGGQSSTMANTDFFPALFRSWFNAEPRYQQFHSSWWGQKDRLNDFINSTSSPPGMLSIENDLFSLGSSAQTNGTLLLRPELVHMYKRLREAYFSIPGIALSGQPGVGKSSAILFFLVACLAYEQRVLFTNDSLLTFFFDENGVLAFSAANNKIPEHHLVLLPALFSGSRPRSLVDSGSENHAPPSALTRSDCLFPVFTVSLNTAHRCQEKIDALWIMLLWKLEDLKKLELDESLPDTFISLTDKEKERILTEARTICAPTPRDYSAFVRYQSQPGDTYKAELVNVVRRLRLQDLEAPFDQFCNWSILSFKIFLVDWTRETTGTGVEWDSVNKQTPAVSQLDRWMFEAFAAQCISGSASDLASRFSPLILMKRLKGTFIFEDASYAGKQPGASALLSPLTPNINFLTFPLVSFSPKCNSVFARKRQIVRYTDISNTEVYLNPELFCLPTQRNNPLFDAFFFHFTYRKKPVVWVLQFMTGRKYCGLQDGYAEIN